jgi:hypothetical protein
MGADGGGRSGGGGTATSARVRRDGVEDGGLDLVGWKRMEVAGADRLVAVAPFVDVPVAVDERASPPSHRRPHTGKEDRSHFARPREAPAVEGWGLANAHLACATDAHGVGVGSCIDKGELEPHLPAGRVSAGRALHPPHRESASLARFEGSFREGSGSRGEPERLGVAKEEPLDVDGDVERGFARESGPRARSSVDLGANVRHRLSAHLFTHERRAEGTRKGERIERRGRRGGLDGHEPRRIGGGGAKSGRRGLGWWIDGWARVSERARARNEREQREEDGQLHEGQRQTRVPSAFKLAMKFDGDA